jgi:rubrerythrin
MLLGSVFVVLAIGVLAFAVITQPFSAHSNDEDDQAAASKETDINEQYQKRLTWLSELETTKMAAKIDEVDYEAQKQALEKEAAAFLVKLEEISIDLSRSESLKIEKMITGRRMQRKERSAGFCPKCGLPIQDSDVFCPGCGEKLSK